MRHALLAEIGDINCVRVVRVQKDFIDYLEVDVDDILVVRKDPGFEDGYLVIRMGEKV